MFLFHSVVCRHGDKCTMITLRHHKNSDVSVKVVSTQDFISPEMPTAVCMRLVNSLVISSAIGFLG